MDDCIAFMCMFVSLVACLQHCVVNFKSIVHEAESSYSVGGGYYQIASSAT